jgi:hypothetical protein
MNSFRGTRRGKTPRPAQLNTIYASIEIAHSEAILDYSIYDLRILVTACHNGAFMRHVFECHPRTRKETHAGGQSKCATCRPAQASGTFDELARSAADQLPDHHGSDQRHPDPNRPDLSLELDRARYPNGIARIRRRILAPPTCPRLLPWRVELQHPPTALRYSSYFLSKSDRVRVLIVILIQAPIPWSHHCDPRASIPLRNQFPSKSPSVVSNRYWTRSMWNDSNCQGQPSCVGVREGGAL